MIAHHPPPGPPPVWWWQFLLGLGGVCAFLVGFYLLCLVYGGR